MSKHRTKAHRGLAREFKRRSAEAADHAINLASPRLYRTIEQAFEVPYLLAADWPIEQQVRAVVEQTEILIDIVGRASGEVGQHMQRAARRKILAPTIARVFRRLHERRDAALWQLPAVGLQPIALDEPTILEQALDPLPAGAARWQGLTA